ncbi:hypothetical protein GVAV_000874 [Gurleya vavrai]
MLTLYIQLQLWFIQAESNNDYSFLNKNYIETLNDNEKMYFFEHQMYKTKQIIDSRASKKQEYTNNVHICIGMSKNKAEASFLKNHSELENLINKLFNKKNFRKCLLKYTQKDNLTKYKSDNKNANQKKNSDLKLDDIQKFFLLKKMYNTMFQLYYNLKLNSNTKKTSCFEVPKDILNYKAFFQIYSQTEQLELIEFFSGALYETQILYYDNCNAKEADLYFSYEYLKLALSEIKSFDRLILISISEIDCRSIKIDEILKKIACLQTNIKNDSIKVFKIVNSAVLGLNVSGTTFYGFYDINFNKKFLSTHKKEIDATSIFKSAAKIEFNIIDKKNLKIMTKNEVEKKSETNVLSIYELDLFYDEKLYKVHVSKQTNDFKNFNEIVYEFRYSTNTFYKFKFDIYNDKNIIKNISINNTQIYNFLKNFLILSEFSFDIYSKIFEQRLDIEYSFPNIKFQSIEYLFFQRHKSNLNSYQTKIIKIISVTYKNSYIEIPYIEKFRDNFKIVKYSKENKLTKYENSKKEKLNTNLYENDYFEFKAKYLFFIKFDYFINFKNENGLEEKYKVSIFPSANSFKILLQHLLQFLNENEIKHNNLIEYIEINFSENVEIALPRYKNYNLMTYRPHLLCFLEFNVENLNIEMLYKSIIDKKYRRLYIKFYFKIFLIKKNLLQFNYRKKTYDEYYANFKIFCDPLVYLEKFFFCLYNNDLPDKTIKDLSNHPFFKLFNISDAQRITIYGFIYLLDNLFSNIDDFIDKNFVFNFEICISKFSFYGTEDRIQSILYRIKQLRLEEN